MPAGAKIVSAESCGISAWTKTAKVSAILPDGSLKRYFVKVNFDTFFINEWLRKVLNRAVRDGAECPSFGPR